LSGSPLRPDYFFVLTWIAVDVKDQLWY